MKEHAPLPSLAKPKPSAPPRLQAPSGGLLAEAPEQEEQALTRTHDRWFERATRPVQAKAVDPGYGDLVTAARSTAPGGPGAAAPAVPGEPGAMRPTAPSGPGVAQRKAPDEPETARSKVPDEPGAARPEATDQVNATGMPTPVRAKMERAFGADFSDVRVHPNSTQATALGAQAFTQGNDVHVAPGRWAPETPKGQELLGHELTHVTQQRAGRVQATKQFKGVGLNDERALEAEADAMGARAAQGDSGEQRPPLDGAAVEKRIDAPVQRRVDPDGAQASAPEGQASASGVVQLDILDSIKGGVATVVRQISPGLADLIEQGPAEYLKQIIKPALQDWVSSLTQGIDLEAMIQTLQGELSEAFSAIQSALAGEGDCCAAFNSAIQAIRDLAKRIAESPAIQMLKGVFQKISDAVGKVAKLVLAPAFDALKGVIGSVWNAVTSAAKTVSGWIQKVKSYASMAWDWVAKQLGLSDDGEAGILDLLTAKAAEVWDSIKETLAPLVGPLKTVGAVLTALSPVGPLYLLIKYGPKVVQAVQWLWQHRNDKDIVKSAREQMQGTILPQLLEAAQGFKGALQSAVTWLIDQVTSLATGALEFLGAVTDVPLLSMAQGFVRSLAKGAQQLAAWCQKEFQAAVTAVSNAVQSVVNFVRPYMEVLGSIGLAIVNPAMIPTILMGWAWRALPDCVKGPLIDLLLDAAILVLEGLPVLPMLGLLWPLVKAGVVGFLKGLRARSTEEKEVISNKLAKIISGASPAFLFGFAKGLLEGLWDGLKDPFEMAWMVVEGLHAVVEWAEGLGSSATEVKKAPAPAPGAGAAGAGAVAAPEATGVPAAQPAEAAHAGGEPDEGLFSVLKGMAAEIGPLIGQTVVECKAELAKKFQGEGMSLDDLISMLGSLWATVSGAIQSMGEVIATKLCDFLMKGGAEGTLGEGVGYLVGTIAFELLLDYFSAGTWKVANATLMALKPFITTVAKGLNWVNTAMEHAFGLLKKLGGMIAGAAQKVGHWLGAGAASLGKLGERIVAWVEKLLGKLGQKGGRTAEKVASERLEKEAAEKLAKEKLEKEVAEKLGGDAAKQVEADAAKKIEEDLGKKAEGDAAKGEKKAAEGEKEHGAREKEGEGKGGEKEKKKEGEGEKKGEPEPGEKAKAEALARAIVAESHLVRPLLPVLLGQLEALRLKYGWIKRFEATRKSPSHYEVFMIASKTDLGDAEVKEGGSETGTEEKKESGGEHGGEGVSAAPTDKQRVQALGESRYELSKRIEELRKANPKEFDYGWKAEIEGLEKDLKDLEDMVASNKLTAEELAQYEAHLKEELRALDSKLPKPPELTPEQLAETRRLENYKQKTEPSELVDAPSFNGGPEGHAFSKHGVTKDVQASILNDPNARVFTGTYPETGRAVDVYWLNGSIVVTEAGKKHSVITAYGLIDKRAARPKAVEVSSLEGYTEIFPK